MISPTTHLCSNENVFARDFDGETVLLDLGSGVYYGLDAVASKAWHEICDQRRSIADAVAKMLTVYEVDEPTLLRDVTTLADEWLSKGLVKVSQ